MYVSLQEGNGIVRGYSMPDSVGGIRSDRVTFGMGLPGEYNTFPKSRAHSVELIMGTGWFDAWKGFVSDPCVEYPER